MRHGLDGSGRESPERRILHATTSGSRGCGTDRAQFGPSYFDRYKTLLQIGRDAGRSVRFIDPLNSSMRFTVADLAKEQPGIGLSELASLLSVEVKIARILAKQAVVADGVDIRFDVAEG